MGAPNGDPALMDGVLDAFCGFVLHRVRSMPSIGSVNHAPAQALFIEHYVGFDLFIDLEDESD